MVDFLFYLTKCVIYNRELSDYNDVVLKDDFDWDSFLKLATDNLLSPVIYSDITKLDKENHFLNDDQKKWITKSAKGTLLPELNKYFLINELAKKSQEKNIRFIFFKGIVWRICIRNMWNVSVVIQISWLTIRTLKVHRRY